MVSTALARFAILAVSVGGCGGKILEERGSGGGRDVVEMPAAGQGPAASVGQKPGGLPQGSKSGVEDACATICERDGACGAGQTDCYQRCADELQGSAGCAAEGSAYIRCYADNLEGCAALPPVCESAYCAFTRCAGKVVPGYCR